MTTNGFIEKAQVLFDRLNNSHLELHKLYDFYDTDIWVRFNKIHSSDAEGVFGSGENSHAQVGKK